MLVSHTVLDTQLGQNPNLARLMRPWLNSREQVKTVADAGDVIGVWTYLAYAQNNRPLVEVADIDHVCLGTNTKLMPPYRPAGSTGPKSGEAGPPPGGAFAPRPNGPPGGKASAGPGDGQPRTRLGECTKQVWPDQQVGFYYAIVEAPLKTGFTVEPPTNLSAVPFETKSSVIEPHTALFPPLAPIL